MKIKILLSISSLFLFFVKAAAQCNPVRFDNFISAYHCTVAQQPDGSFMVWGEDMGNDGVSDILSPANINSALYPSLTGSILFASLGSKGADNTGQGILLTTTGLFTWGNEGVILDAGITSGTGFQKLTINGQTNGLPPGVNPADVKNIFTAYQLLAILTNSGSVYVIAQSNTAVRGAGPGAGSSTQWYQVTSSNIGNPPIANITMIKGNGRGSMMAVTSDGTSPYVWGASALVGDGSAAASLNRAEHITLPLGVSGTNVKLIGLTSRDGETTTYGSSYYLLANNGTLYAMGDNSAGQLGDFTTTSSTSWINVKKDISTNFTDCIFFSPQEHDEENASVNAIDNSFTVYNWGQNTNQLLGRTGSPLNPGIPDGFSPGITKAFSVETGGDFTIHVKDGSPKYCYAGQKINDAGDAPLSFEGNGTTDLAVHNITAANAGTLYLGSTPPIANNFNLKNVSPGNSNISSNGDGNEEDALSTVKGYFNSGSHTYTVTLINTSGGNANLYGWVDWNRDGDFLDAGEMASVIVPNGATTADITWSGVSEKMVPGVKHYIRMRLTTNSLTSPLGYASDGEVEDYFLKIVPLTPDVNVTRVNLSIDGNLSTNDEAPAGTTYGAAVADPGNPGPALPTVNTDGTYTFLSAVKGVFYFDIPVCPPGQSTGCEIVQLRIAVNNPGGSQVPVVNTDIVSTKVDQWVSIFGLINDSHTTHFTELDPSSVTVIVPPAHGTTGVFPSGNIAYTPTAGYTGTDTLTYRVCDDKLPTPACATAKQVIKVLPADAENLTEASDDYHQLIIGQSVSDNVLTNDKDPEGNTQTAVAQNITIPGKGTLVLNTNGSFTFTPDVSFTGGVEFPYTKCDNGSPQACKNASLHLLMIEPGALPVKLESFSANLKECVVTLNWKTSLETNFSAYHIEYSKDGANFSAIDVITGRGDNSNYSTVHKNPAEGKAYYRLRMVDIDGRQEYSKVVTVNINCFRSFLRVFPTPVTDGKLNINIASLNGVFDSKLFNSVGQLLITKKVYRGSNTMDVSKLAPGVYYLNLEMNGEKESFRVLIK
jgi:GEVED domain/Bacterial Ig domain/Secretion system C-terminal sorting domain